MKTILSTLLTSLWLSHIPALCSTMIEAHNNTTEKRQSSSCGDRSLALTFYQGYDSKGHALNTAPAFAFDDTNGNFWEMGEAAFRAWGDPGQPSTVPLYGLSNPNPPTDYAYLISTNGSAPTLSGFTTGGILAYVYPTQICGSVPLYAASKASVGDHWYTTDLAEHNEIIKLGWVDAGVTAYVLPLIDCACGSY